MALSYTTTIRNNQLTQVVNAVDAGSGAGKVRIYSGSAPANVGTALSGNTLLAELPMSDPCGTVTGGVLTFSAITDDSSADATGTASFFRILDSDNNAVVQGTVGTSGADLNISPSVSLVAGGTVEITSFTITAGNA